MIRIGTVIIDNDEISEVLDTLQKGIISAGPKVKRFEEEIASYHNLAFGAMCNSGQSALHVALEVAKRNYGIDNVVVPASSYISTVAACWQANLDVIFCDVEEDTYNMDFTKIPHLTKSSAIIPVDLYGRICEVPEEFRKYCIVRDACEAVGKIPVGYGDFIVFSFYVAHMITTGVGGMVLTHDKEDDKLCRRMINYGRHCCCRICKTTSNEICPNARYKFSFVDEGFSYKPTDVLASIGLGQMKKLSKIIKRREENVKLLVERLKDYPIQLPKPEALIMFPIVCSSRKEKDALVKILVDNDIETRPFFDQICQPVVMNKMGDISSNFPVASKLTSTGFVIGCHPDIDKEQIDEIAKVVGDFYGS